VEWHELARRQHGVLGAEQAALAGLTSSEVRWRLTSGRWQSLGRGLYLTHSGEVSWIQRAQASVLRAGRGGVLTGISAAYLHGLLAQPPTRVTLAIPRSRRVVPLPWMTVQRRNDLPVVVRRGLPVLAAPWTVLDLAGAPQATWRDAVAECARAVQRRRVTVSQLVIALDCRPRHRHRRVLEVALGAVGEGAESLPEVGYLIRVQRRHALPPGSPQRVDGSTSGVVRRDFWYRAYGVVVEVDGRLGHEGPGMWRDRRRDRSAARDGLVTLRCGAAEIEAAPCELAADVAATLRARGYAGPITACGLRCDVRRLLSP